MLQFTHCWQLLHYYLLYGRSVRRVVDKLMLGVYCLVSQAETQKYGERLSGPIKVLSLAVI
jgi:hypothetical protein